MSIALTPQMEDVLYFAMQEMLEATEAEAADNPSNPLIPAVAEFGVTLGLIMALASGATPDEVNAAIRAAAVEAQDDLA